jgi:hypothetical protein
MDDGDHAMGLRFWLPLLVVTLAPACARAHAIDLEWKQINDRIMVEAFFDDDTPARDALVTIVDDEKNVVASAKTDAQGKCSLRAPIGRYQIVVDAGAGHRKERPIRIVGTLPPPPESKETPTPAVLSGGANRDEVTGFPWERAAIGCGVIALLAGAWWLSRRPKPPVAASRSE